METPPIIRARKLLAMAAPSSGASERERATATARLTELLEREGITLEDLAGLERAEHTLKVYTENQAVLAVQLAAWIKNENTGAHVRQGEEWAEPTGRRKKPRLEPCIFVRVDLTATEARDWRAAFVHYAPDLATTEKLLADVVKLEKANVRLARAQLKSAKRDQATAELAQSKAAVAFINRNQLFPESAKTSAKPLPAEERDALIRAMRLARASEWKRPQLALT